MTQTRTPHMTDYEAERRNFHLDQPELSPSTDLASSGVPFP